MSAKPPGKVWLEYYAPDHDWVVFRSREYSPEGHEYILASDAAAELEAARAVIAELVALHDTRDYPNKATRWHEAWTAARAWLGKEE